MKLDLLSIEYEPQAWFWLSIVNVEYGDQDRSLLYIEKNGNVWKFQLLWLTNYCWIINQTFNTKE
jgi:hypothetical protein